MPGISISKLAIPFRTGGRVNWETYWTSLISATVENAAPTHVVLTFPTAQTSLVASDFTIAGFTINSASWTGAVLTLVLSTEVKYTDSLIVTFVKTGGTKAVTNNIIPYFITTWQTENAGSATKTIVIPTTGAGYACYVNWGDGSAEEYFSGTAPAISHVYPTTGVKTVKIRGLFPRIYFNNAGDRLKLLTIAQWGNIVWSLMSIAFYGCENLTGTYTDVPNTAAVTSMYYMFGNCFVFNSPVNFNTAAVQNMGNMFFNCRAFNQSVSNFSTVAVTNMSLMFSGCYVFNQSVASFNTAAVQHMPQMFYDCHAFNQSVANFNTAAVTNMYIMFASCYVFNQSIAHFNVALVTNMTSMFASAFKMTTANYDALLIAWSAQAVQNSVAFHAGTATYTQTLVDSGTTDGAAAGKLIQSGQNFVTTVTIGDVVRNTTDGTYAIVTAIDSDTQLSISVDIMATAEAFTIQHSDAAKGRAHLVLSVANGGHGWTITDSGPI